MIKEPEKKPPTPIINPYTSLEVKNKVFISSPFVPDIPAYMLSSKELTP